MRGRGRDGGCGCGCALGGKTATPQAPHADKRGKSGRGKKARATRTWTSTWATEWVLSRVSEQCPRYSQTLPGRAYLPEHKGKTRSGRVVASLAQYHLHLSRWPLTLPLSTSASSASFGESDLQRFQVAGELTAALAVLYSLLQSLILASSLPGLLALDSLRLCSRPRNDLELYSSPYAASRVCVCWPNVERSSFSSSALAFLFSSLLALLNC